MVNQQSSLADIRIEDPELEDALQRSFDNAEAAADFRGANKLIKEMLKNKHKNVVNTDDDGEHSGWVVCGGFRFKPRNKYRSAEKVEFDRAEGFDWSPLEIERLER